MDIRTINIVLDNSSRQEWAFVGENSIVWKNDVLLRIEYICKEDRPASMINLYSQSISNPRRVLCKIFYGSSLIENVIVASVDDGRAYLPVPNGNLKTVTKHEANIARLLSNGTFDVYLQKAGLTIV